jgi:hypothetical protein
MRTTLPPDPASHPPTPSWPTGVTPTPTACHTDALSLLLLLPRRGCCLCPAGPMAAPSAPGPSRNLLPEQPPATAATCAAAGAASALTSACSQAPLHPRVPCCHQRLCCCWRDLRPRLSLSLQPSPCFAARGGDSVARVPAPSSPAQRLPAPLAEQASTRPPAAPPPRSTPAGPQAGALPLTAATPPLEPPRRPLRPGGSPSPASAPSRQRMRRPPASAAAARATPLLFSVHAASRLGAHRCGPLLVQCRSCHPHPRLCSACPRAAPRRPCRPHAVAHIRACATQVLPPPRAALLRPRPATPTGFRRSRQLLAAATLSPAPPRRPPARRLPVPPSDQASTRCITQPRRPPVRAPLPSKQLARRQLPR